jgi:transposase
MFNLPVKNIYLANELVDMRKSYDTLADYIKFHLKEDPLSGDAFIFIGKRRDRLKVLICEDSGFWLISKRLEQGTFSKNIIKNNGNLSMRISPAQWHNLLEGIIVKSSRKLKRYKRKIIA